MSIEDANRIRTRYYDANGGKISNLRIIRDVQDMEGLPHIFVGQSSIRGWIHKDCRRTEEMSKIMLYIYEKKIEMRDDPDGFFNHLSNNGFILWQFH